MDQTKICVISTQPFDGFCVHQALPPSPSAEVVVFADPGCSENDLSACGENTLQTGHISLGVQKNTGFFNMLTGLVFRFFGGLKLQDVQPAIIALPVKDVPARLPVRGRKTRLLLLAKKSGLEIDQIPITPVPVKNPNLLQLMGSWLLILGHFLKYGLSAVFSAVLEEGLLALFGRLFLGLLSGFAFTFATAGLSRLISSVCNFFINQKLVFESKGSTLKALLRYYALALPNALLQIGLSHGAYLLFGISEAQTLLRGLIHFGVMVLLFLCSFVLQQRWVFVGKKD